MDRALACPNVGFINVSCGLTNRIPKLIYLDWILLADPASRAPGYCMRKRLLQSVTVYPLFRSSLLVYFEDCMMYPLFRSNKLYILQTDTQIHDFCCYRMHSFLEDHVQRNLCFSLSKISTTRNLTGSITSSLLSEGERIQGLVNLNFRCKVRTFGAR